MLKIFDEFRERLDQVMVKAFGHRVVLWGYGYTGRFLEWYAEYYHSIKIDFIITEDWSTGMPYNFPLFRDSLFEFDYMDVKDAVIWLALPEKAAVKKLKGGGYVKGRTYFNFLEIIFGNDYICPEAGVENVYQTRKTGLRDVQFMEWLEYIYGCNFVTAIETSQYASEIKGAHSYRISTQKEIFPILDKCHCIPQEEDAIFDFGCGKGGAMVAFMDYGFKKVGGVEYEPHIYDVMMDNFNKLGIDIQNISDNACIQGDAASVKVELDGYNWFYYFDPFDKEVFEKTIINICDSLKRKPRKIHIININPKFYNVVLNSGCFKLTNQFCAATRQKVVDVFVTKKEYE